MARWGELKCPNCAVLEAKLRNAEWRFEHLKKYGDTKDTREFATEGLAELTSSEAATKEGGKDE